AAERVAHQRSCLEALQERRPEALGLGEGFGLARGEPVREATDGTEHQAAERMLGIVGRAAQLRSGIVARGLDDLPLHDLAPQYERDEPLAAGAKRACRAIEPPVELDRRAWTAREVRERRGERRERDPGALARGGAREPAAGRRIDGQLAELPLQGAID